jgi:hypothetical protein
MTPLAVFSPKLGTAFCSDLFAFGATIHNDSCNCRYGSHPYPSPGFNVYLFHVAVFLKSN